MVKDTTTFFNIPEWAIYALQYGTNECDYLSDKEVYQINNFIDEYNLNGQTMYVDWSTYNEFDIKPVFGKPCKTYKVDFVVIINE